MPRRLRAVAVDAPACGLGESPRWGHGAWWWVDAAAGTVWTAGPGLTATGAGGGPRQVLSTRTRVSLVLPADRGRIVVARGTDLLIVDPRHGVADTWARIDLPAGWLLNDGVADNAGRLWIGSVHPDRVRKAGALHVVGPGGTVRTVATGFTLSNGMAWKSARTLIHADSGEACLWEHAVDPESGSVVGSCRVLAVVDGLTVPEQTGSAEHTGGAAAPALPDGMALDQEGALWLALYGAGQVWRISEGRVQAVLEVPTRQVTSVALGGPDGRDLLVTTAQEGMDADELDAAPYAGRLFTSRVEIPGVPLPVLRPAAVHERSPSRLEPA